MLDLSFLTGFEALGLDVAIIAAIVALTWAAKKIPGINGWVVLVPVFLGTVAAVALTDPLTLRAVTLAAIKNAGGAVLAWNLWEKFGRKRT